MSVASGHDTDRVVAALLGALDAFLLDDGVDTKKFSARELCVLPKVPKPAPWYAIPDYNLWSRVTTTIVAVAQPIRFAFGSPCSIKGYRPRDYNAAVGGEVGSRHVYFEALDMRPMDGRIERLREVACDLFVAHPDLSIGLGLYDGNIHVDLGHRRRVWGSQMSDLEAAMDRLDDVGTVPT